MFLTDAIHVYFMLISIKNSKSNLTSLSLTRKYVVYTGHLPKKIAEKNTRSQNIFATLAQKVNFRKVLAVFIFLKMYILAEF
jgi:hypothetical protein